MSQFRTALALLGSSGSFDALLAALPTANGGMTPPAEAAEALRNLDVFATSPERWTTRALVDVPYPFKPQVGE